MPSGPLHPDVALSIRLSAIMSRHRYTHDPAPVIDELYRLAGDRIDLDLSVAKNHRAETASISG